MVYSSCPHIYEVDMEFIGVLQYDKRIIKMSEEIYPFIIRYPTAAVSKNIFSILHSLNNSDLNKHEVRKFRQFKTLLKEQKKFWN